MTMPNFFIIGAQKAGTTSLYHYLAQHPRIFMSAVKEPRFFNHEISADGKVIREEYGDPIRRRTAKFASIGEYRVLFKGVRDETAIGEASPPYIYVPGTAERIKRYVPEAKIVALLRNPADRAYSSFLHSLRYGREKVTDFAQVLEEEEKRINDNWHYSFHYRNRGLYREQLEPYYELFGRDRVGVWLYEDMRSDPVGVAQSVFRFLEVDDLFVPNTSLRHNPAAVPEGMAARLMMRAMDKMATTFLEAFTPTSRLFPLASRMRQRIQRRILKRPPPIDPGIRRELIEWYREDILKLQELIGRDLSLWLGSGTERNGEETAVPRPISQNRGPVRAH